ncbi:efflux RND transporter periplasmic adaptor subunit [Methylobacterium oryzihabitans]|nr:efflux RND transporter periplasmic adaptor subunit [Methylobacterium oryzihabitans]
MRLGVALPAALAATLAMAGAVPAAGPDRAAEAPVRAPSRPGLAEIRTVTARVKPVADTVVLTGDVQAKFLSNISFRVSGKIAERKVEVGDHVAADTVMARLEPQEQKVNLDTAQAALVSAEAQLTQARLTFERQKTLMRSGYTTRSAYDQAEQTLRTTQAAVESAQAALGTAREQLSYTDLTPGVAGIVTARNAEAGQVVQAGQTVFTLAQDGPRDAVFTVSETLLAVPPESKQVEIVLQSNPAVRTTGTVREISPAIDPNSGGVRVKIGLDRVPPEMGLGAVVIGRGRFRPQDAVTLPWSALFRWQDGPAVWVLDPATRTVQPRPVRIARYAGSALVLAGGVEGGEQVVSAGIQLLRPGQEVAVVGEGAL